MDDHPTSPAHVISRACSTREAARTGSRCREPRGPHLARKRHAVSPGGRSLAGESSESPGCAYAGAGLGRLLDAAPTGGYCRLANPGGRGFCRRPGPARQALGLHPGGVLGVRRVTGPLAGRGVRRFRASRPSLPCLPLADRVRARGGPVSLPRRRPASGRRRSTIRRPRHVDPVGGSHRASPSGCESCQRR